MIRYAKLGTATPQNDGSIFFAVSYAGTKKPPVKNIPAAASSIVGVTGAFSLMLTSLPVFTSCPLPVRRGKNAPDTLRITAKMTEMMFSKAGTASAKDKYPDGFNPASIAGRCRTDDLIKTSRSRPGRLPTTRNDINRFRKPTLIREKSTGYDAYFAGHASEREHYSYCTG